MNREFSKVVVITGCNTDNPNFQWYWNKIGEKYRVVRVIDWSQNGFSASEQDWYRVVMDSPSPTNFYIHISDCMTIDEFRNNKLTELGINMSGMVSSTLPMMPFNTSLNSYFTNSYSSNALYENVIYGYPGLGF